MDAARHFTARAAACILGIAAAAHAAPRTIAPYANRALPPAIGKYANDVTWSGASALMVATEHGVYAVGSTGGTPAEVIKGIAVPDGLPEPTALSSDGKWVSAISWDSNGGFALRLADRKRLVAQRSFRLIPMDVAISGNRTCVVGFIPAPASESLKDVAASCGGPSDSWAELTPLHHLRNDHARDLFRDSPAVFGGHIVIEPDGTVDVITSIQAGVFRYGADGKLKDLLGKAIDDLVFESVGEIRTRFASDLENRYRLVLNAQPLIEDLVATPGGPAILVRIAQHDMIHWELWYPLRSGGVGEKIRLGIDRIGPYGHLRCDAHGADLACVGSLPPRKDAAVARTAQAWPHLWLFHLPAQLQTASR